MIGAWSVLIGRSADCNIILEQPEISRHHLLVRLGDAGVVLWPNNFACAGAARARSSLKAFNLAWCLTVSR